MTDEPERFRVIVEGEAGNIDVEREAHVAAIVGNGGYARSGTEALSFAGEDGIAQAGVYGIAIGRRRAQALGGAGTVAIAWDGGASSGGDGSLAWTRRDGTATVNEYGVAVALDSVASGQQGSVAVSLRQNATAARAEVGPMGVAVVHNHPVLNSDSRPALAVAGKSGVAVAFGGNWEQGELGALLVASYVDNGAVLFAVGVVDGNNILANQRYGVDAAGKLMPILI